jgi:ATP-dependent RNA helicase RhlE
LHALVLDEADQMLDMGFVNDVKNRKAYSKKQTNTLFSATMPIAIRTG